MKLTKDLPGLLTKKWTKPTWASHEYVFFDGILWMDDELRSYPIERHDLCCEDWQEWVPPKVKKSGWINIYKDGTCDYLRGDALFAAKDEAIRNRIENLDSRRRYVATIEISWEE